MIYFFFFKSTSQIHFHQKNLIHVSFNTFPTFSKEMISFKLFHIKSFYKENCLKANTRLHLNTCLIITVLNGTNSLLLMINNGDQLSKHLSFIYFLLNRPIDIRFYKHIKLHKTLKIFLIDIFSKKFVNWSLENPSPQNYDAISQLKFHHLKYTLKQLNCCQSN